MKIRTPVSELRSLALSAICTTVWLDRLSMGCMPGCQPLVMAQLDHLLGVLARVDRLGAEALHGLISPGAGEHVLGAIAESVGVPDSVENWPSQPVPAFPLLAHLLDRLSAELAAGTSVDEDVLRELCGDLAIAAMSAREQVAE